MVANPNVWREFVTRRLTPVGRFDSVWDHLVVQPRASRWLVVALGALVVGVVVAAAHPTVVRAGNCGRDSLPACPSIDSVSPRGWESGPGRVTVTIAGQLLLEVSSVALEPGARELPITSATNDVVTVIAPESLAVGGYRLHLTFGGRLRGVAIDSPMLYITSNQAAVAPVISFAPNPSLVTPATAAAAPKRTATAPAQPASHGLLFFLGGLLAGGIACLYLARRLGTLPRNRVVEAERVASAAAWVVPSPAADQAPQGGPGWSVRPQTPHSSR